MAVRRRQGGNAEARENGKKRNREHPTYRPARSTPGGKKVHDHLCRQSRRPAGKPARPRPDPCRPGGTATTGAKQGQQQTTPPRPDSCQQRDPVAAQKRGRRSFVCPRTGTSRPRRPRRPCRLRCSGSNHHGAQKLQQQGIRARQVHSSSLLEQPQTSRRPMGVQAR